MKMALRDLFDALGLDDLILLANLAEMVVDLVGEKLSLEVLERTIVELKILFSELFDWFTKNPFTKVGKTSWNIYHTVCEF